MINDVLVARNDTVYVVTTLGLAKSLDQGRSWEYERGRDFVDKVCGRATPPHSHKMLAGPGTHTTLIARTYASASARLCTAAAMALMRAASLARCDVAMVSRSLIADSRACPSGRSTGA